MGKTANFARARNQDVRQKHDQRVKRSQVERERRLGTEQAGRQLARVYAARKLPTEADRALLLHQFTQACRLAAPSSDLVLLIRHYAGALAKPAEAGKADAAATPATATAGTKRARDEVEEAAAAKGETNPAALNSLADVFLSTVSAPVLLDDEDDDNDDEGEDPMTLLLTILQNDCGRRVVTALLEALHGTPGCEAQCLAVAHMALEQFEENEHLAGHYVACRVLSALVRYGPAAVRLGVLALLRQRCMSLEAVRGLLSDRHTSVTVENLLVAQPTETSAWLCEALGLSTPAAAAGKKGAAKKKTAAAVDAESLTEEELLALIEGPVSGQVVRQLINAATRPLLMARLDISALLNSRRGASFLGALLSVTDGAAGGNATDGGVFAATLEMLLEKTGVAASPPRRGGYHNRDEESAGTATMLQHMAFDRSGNFLVQKVLLLIPHTPAKEQTKFFRRVVHLLGDAKGVQDLSRHNIGVHVVCALVDAAQQCESGAIAEEAGGLVLTQGNVADLSVGQNGSLIVRRLMPLVRRHANSAVGHLLRSALEQNLTPLMKDPIGNLVVQEYVRALGPAEASAFAKKIRKEDLFEMSRHQYSSHVVSALLDAIDATTHVTICNVFKPTVCTLALHLNGRFIVEKLIPSSRDVRDELVGHFTQLAMERGTQHVLCTLVANLDPHGKQKLIDNIIVPRVRDMAANSCGSIALQKLMQSDAAILAAVKRRLAADPALANELVQTFTGKFVVQIATHVGN